MKPDRTDTDETLLRRFARAGDEAAMAELVERHGAALGAFLAGWCEEAADAMDLAQEAWVRVMRSPEAFKGGSFRAWILRIARNLAIDRSRRKRPELWLDAPAGTADGAPSLVETLPDDSVPAPDEALASAEERAMLLAAVRGLPGPQRDVFLLRAAGVPFSEIAAGLSMPLNTALGRMHDAMTKLRAVLGAERGKRR